MAEHVHHVSRSEGMALLRAIRGGWHRQRLQNPHQCCQQKRRLELVEDMNADPIERGVSGNVNAVGSEWTITKSGHTVDHDVHSYDDWKNEMMKAEASAAH